MTGLQRFHAKVNFLCAALNKRDNEFKNFGSRDFTKADYDLDQQIVDFLRCADELNRGQIVARTSTTRPATG
jgi:hypothetical protein